ncbi:hypothetical protein HOLleu_31115 [Holothuria leucospilota]|uniref:Uncharacterized protein n=1 Tax=Holothuria leucospilota TaxID=206669 RepID=A0A9Q1BLF4_HOLLE|nr:hypothetical protein HOLleu_31115 [Holothuria leucospilota]
MKSPETIRHLRQAHWITRPQPHRELFVICANIVTDDPDGIVARLRHTINAPSTEEFARKVADNIDDKEDDTKRNNNTT